MLGVCVGLCSIVTEAAVYTANPKLVMESFAHIMFGARVSKQGDTNLSQSPVLNINHIDRLPLFPLTDA